MESRDPKGFSCTAEGEVVLFSGEALLRMVSLVDLYDGDVKAQRGGTVYLTSLRILWGGNSGVPALAWNLDSVASFSEEAAGFALTLGVFNKPSPKISLQFRRGGKCLKFSFKAESTGHKDMLTDLAGALSGLGAAKERCSRIAREEAERECERNKPAPPPPPVNYLVPAQHQFSKSLEQEKKKNETLTFFSGAFSSLPDLARTLRELQSQVSLLSADAAKDASGGGGAGGGGSEEELMGVLLRDMGSVSNPVTKAMAPGRDYSPALARQVASFIKPRVQGQGGIMPLTDVYAMYNRARGMDIISPEDLLDAAKVMGGLGVGLKLSTLGSLMVLQLEELNETSMARRAEGWVSLWEKRGYKFATPQVCAEEERVPLAVAAKHLELGVAMGLLALDTSIAGKRYYRNYFSLTRS